MLQHVSEQDQVSDTPAEEFNPLSYREPDEAANDNEPEEGLNAREITLMTKGVYINSAAQDEEEWTFDEAAGGELNFSDARRARRGFLDDAD